MQTSQKCEDSQTMIIALLVSYKEGCLLSQLCKDYYEMAGEGIPWKELGYSSLMNFLQSMSRSIQIEYRNGAVYLKGIASNKSKHISKLINSQKTEKPMLGRRVFKPSHYYPTTAPFKVQIPAEVLSLIISIVNEHPDGVNKDYVLQKVQDCLPHINITMREMEEQLYRLSHKISLSTNKIFPVQKKLQISDSKLSMETAAGEEDLNNFSDGDDLDFVSHANNEFKEVNERSKSNISKSYNFYNCSDDTTHVNNSNYGNVENENNIENKHIEDLINSRVRFRLEKLIQNNPDGIWCADLPEKYLEEYKVPLNYTELGFSSVREYASKLPNIFRCVQIDDTGDFILYHSKAEMLSIHSKEKREAVNLTKLHQVYPIDNENEALPTVVTLSTCNQMIPECVVTIGESVGQLNVTELVCKEKPYIEVVVVEVFTPTFFWIQLRKKQKAFKSLMDDLHNFYETNCQDYIVPPVILEKGLNCACIYNNIWHRGIIKTVKPDFQVIVMFYDYGTLKTYKANEVYYLHRKFSNLPAQAIPCGLYNVRPYKSTKWSRNATHQFAVRTSCIPLVATVESQWINETDNSMLITLTDTLEEEDVHINDWLVEQNLAEHGKMVCIKKRNFPYHYFVECQKSKQQNSKTQSSNTVVKPVRNVGKPLPKLQFLYEKFITPKRSSQSSDGNFTEFNDHAVIRQSSNCDPVLNKSDNSRCNNQDKDNDDRNDDPTSVQFTKEKTICKTLNEQDNVLRNYRYMPKIYAHYFHIQDPNDEVNLNSDVYNEKREFKYIDWSVVQKNITQNKNVQQNFTEKTYKSLLEKREKIVLPENYFSRAVKNSVHFAERDENIGWLPNGNINKVEDPSPLVLRNIQKRALSNLTDKTICIPEKILDILVEKESSTEILESSTDSSKSIHSKSSSASVQEKSSIISNNSSHSNDVDNKTNISDENLQINSDSNSTSHIENNYIHMKSRIPQQKLLEILLMKINQSSCSSVLDSDDFSEKSYSYNSNTSKLHIDKNESSKEPEPSVSSESLELSKSLSRDKSYEESTFLERSVFLEASDLVEESGSVQSIDTQEHNLTGQVIDKRQITLQAKELVENESKKISSELVPISKSFSPDVTTTVPSVPVFDDIDLESIGSGDEEWYIHMRDTDLHYFLKSDSPFNRNVNRTLEYDARLSKEQVNNSGFIEDINGANSAKSTNINFDNSSSEYST